MDSDQPDIKPLQNGFPPLHLLSAVNTSATSVSTPVVAGTSFIPVFQPNMFGSPGIIGLPLTLNQQALFQANMDAALARSVKSSATTSAIVAALQENSDSVTNNDIKPSLKRKFSETGQLNSAVQSSITSFTDNLVKIQPKTKKGKVYSWMLSAHPKRQRARISEPMKKEILEFCKNHSMLKQGEVADIFGVDRTTVTKMLKRQEIKDEGEPVYDPCRKYNEPQYELEDMLYRWIANATKHHPINHPVWSCDQLLEQAQDLQNLTETGSSFYADMDWLIDFVERFRLRRVISDCK